MKLAPIASGGLALIVLQVVLSSEHTGRLGDLLQLPGSWAEKLIDPGTPAIPNVTGSNGVDIGGPVPSTPPAVYTTPPAPAHQTPSAPPAPSAPKPTYNA